MNCIFGETIYTGKYSLFFLKEHHTLGVQKVRDSFYKFETYYDEDDFNAKLEIFNPHIVVNDILDTQRSQIDFLSETETSLIKNQTRMAELISYLERNKPYIPCYEIRKQLGLKNSSAIGEKMNDLVVAERQKHNGMSWSKEGSVALASITALKRNNESRRWFEEKELDFKLVS